MKFSIRDLLLVTALAALALGWGVDHWRLSQKLAAAQQSAEAYFLELTRVSPPPTAPLPMSRP